MRSLTEQVAQAEKQHALKTQLRKELAAQIATHQAKNDVLHETQSGVLQQQKRDLKDLMTLEQSEVGKSQHQLDSVTQEGRDLAARVAQLNIKRTQIGTVGRWGREAKQYFSS